MLNEVLVRQRQGLALPHSSTVPLQPRQHQPRSTPRAKRRCCAISPHQWRAGLAGTASATQPSSCHVPSHRSVAHLGQRWHCTRKHHLSRRRKPESPRRNCWELLLPQHPCLEPRQALLWPSSTATCSLQHHGCSCSARASPGPAPQRRSQQSSP